MTNPLSDCYKCYDTGRNPFLVVRSRNGAATAFNYSFVSRITFDPDRGITLTHGREKFILRGARLQHLFMVLAAANVAVIRAFDPEIVSVPEHEPLVVFAGTVMAAPPQDSNGDTSKK
jgi:hypothetical protein